MRLAPFIAEVAEVAFAELAIKAQGKRVSVLWGGRDLGQRGGQEARVEYGGIGHGAIAELLDIFGEEEGRFFAERAGEVAVVLKLVEGRLQAVVVRVARV